MSLEMRKVNRLDMTAAGEGKMKFEFDENGLPVKVDEERNIVEIDGGLQTLTLAQLLSLQDVPNGRQYIVTGYPHFSMSLFTRINDMWSYVGINLYEEDLSPYVDSITPNTFMPLSGQAAQMNGMNFTTGSEITMRLNTQIFVDFIISDITSTTMEVVFDFSEIPPGEQILTIYFDTVLAGNLQIAIN